MSPRPNNIMRRRAPIGSRVPAPPPRTSLVREGRGPLTRECGLVFQAFRPSDDACQLGFNIPGNAFFASTLGHLAPLLGRNPLKARVLDLASSIEEGIGAHGMIRRPEPHLAYEVNGMGGQLFMDDANLPSLLGLPYLGVMEAGGPLYQATRRRVLSEANPHFVTAPRLRGVGFPAHPARSRLADRGRRRRPDRDRPGGEVSGAAHADRQHRRHRVDA